MRTNPKPLLGCAVVILAGGLAFTEPPTERTLVQAVADVDQNRILVRWMQVEGNVQRYTSYDILRRESTQNSFSQLNIDPITALPTASQITTVFTAPGRADALAMIQEVFGADYANDLLVAQGPGANGNAKLQLKMLPDQNYGAAIALGVGYMDEPVVSGVTYVYEVWGLDSQGFRTERIGRASAEAGVPPVISAPLNPECVNTADLRSHMTAPIRWDEAPAAASEYTVGYDVLRAHRLPNNTCPMIGPNLPGVVKTNDVPILRDAPGNPVLGETLFSAKCASCHAGGRDPSQAGNVAGTTLDQFRRRQDPALWPTMPMMVTHNTQPLNVLTPGELLAIYEWIDEYHFRDDGAATPSDPLVAGETYCYRVFPRNLLGEYGAAAPPAQCLVRDLKPPRIPYAIASKLFQQGGTHETCEISWRRNAAAGDDTASYELMRAGEVPRVGEPPALAGWPKVIAQPAGGSRVTYSDLSLAPADAGGTFFYAARARDSAGNKSAWSGWVPCVPRDIVAPPAATLTAGCCDRGPAGACVDRGQDTRWVSAGGDRVIIADPARCPAHLTCGGGSDTFRCRIYRSFDGSDPIPGEDFDPASPIPLNYEPLIDQQIWWQMKTIDRSGNLGPLSTPLKLILKGKHKLPPPRIVQVSVVDEATALVRIRFRSLEPNALLGFILYKQYNTEPNIAPKEYVARYHDNNLAGSQNDPTQPPDPAEPDQWTLRPNAKTLDQQPGVIPSTFICPTSLPSTGGFLCYDDLKGQYVMQAGVQETHDLILHLAAIGWSGQEGYSVPYVWDGWVPDDVLDWPTLHAQNYLFEPAQASALTVTPSSGTVQLTWTAYPSGCDGTAARPFIVFRKRGGADRWQQISPPFTCDGANTAMSYRDNDIQSGLSYTYTVIRLGSMGEFSFKFGPASGVAP